VKCLRHDPSIIVLDEPTSVLTTNESIVLFEVIRQMVTDHQHAVILISHKLDEVMRATDVITVMRRGRVVHHGPTAATNPPALAQHMVGRDVDLGDDTLDTVSLGTGGLVDSVSTGVHVGRSGPAHVHADAEPPLLQLREVVVRAPGREHPVLDGLTLDVFGGEILGIAGVEGNGQLALGSLLAGLEQLSGGTFTIDGSTMDPGAPGATTRAGIAVITEDRHHDGVALDLSVQDNLNVFDSAVVADRGVLSRRRARARALELIERFEIRCPSPDTPLRALSGGNQQRVVVARELSRNPKVLVAAQPTRGLDVGAIEFMLARLRQAAAEGIGVVLISTELEEILGLADRIAVMSRGRIIGQMRRDEADLAEIGLLLGGSQRGAA
jgi:general nucleoside transport system ATP-binding protein